MKFKTKIFIIVLVTLIFNTLCFAQNDSNSYSVLLKEAVIKAGEVHGKFKISIDPQLPQTKKLCSTEAIPFLLDVIKNGHDWSLSDNEEYLNYPLQHHIARCYALLCLAYTKDPQAYPILTDILKYGKYLDETGIYESFEIDEYDIKRFAIGGLGILEDPRAIDLLITSLDDPNLVISSMNALVKIGDMRAIKPIFNAGRKYKIEGVILGGFLERLTKVNFESTYNRNNKTITFSDFSGLNAVKLDEDPYMKVWLEWLNNGKNLTKQKFDEKFNEYSKVKQSRPNENSAINYNRNKIANLGIAALPLIIEKIVQGETDLIPLVSQLSNTQVKNDAEVKEVLDWWKANKDKLTIFDYDQ